MIALVLALVAAAQAVQVAKRNFDMCTVCTGVVSEFKAMLVAGATVQQASDAMLDTGCLAFNDQQAEVSYCVVLVLFVHSAIFCARATHDGKK